MQPTVCKKLDFVIYGCRMSALMSVVIGFLEYNFAECSVVVGGVIDVTAAAINKSVCAAIVSKVIDIGFVVIRCRESSFAIVEVVAADHHAERCMRIEIPFHKSFAGLLFVKLYSFALGDIIDRQAIVVADVLCNVEPQGVFLFGGIFF